MIVYGRHAVREALRGPRSVSRVWITKTAATEPWLAGAGVSVALVASASEQIQQREEAVEHRLPARYPVGVHLERRCGSGAHQGVCAEVEPFRYAQADAVLTADAPLLVALDQVQDPQNLGAICRSAECAGADAVVIAERRSAEVTAAVCKASAGAVEHLPVARVRNLADFLIDCKAAGMWCYGADAGASVAYDSVDYRGGVVLVLGSEGRGLRPRVAATCDALVAIPLRGRVQSLSVSAAAAVLLYAASRPRA